MVVLIFLKVFAISICDYYTKYI